MGDDLLKGNKFYILIQMYKIVIFFLSVAAVASLHSPHPLEHLLQRPLQHAQNATASPTFDQEFGEMRAIADNISTALKGKDATQYEYLITKASQIQAGLRKLQSTLQGYNLLVTSSSKLCPGVTTFNRNELRKYISYTESKEKLFLQYVATCADCAFVAADIMRIQNLTNSYIQNLNKTMDGDYCPKDRTKGEQPQGLVNLNGSYFKNNLKADNWYYGSTTASDYKIYMFKRSASYNLTNCPLETPFVRDEEQVCFDCPEGSIFNLGTQKCDTCNSDEILNIQSGQCDKCLGEKKVEKGALVCKLCVLAEGQLFNLTSGKCYKCKNDSYLDAEKQVCVKIDCGPATPRFNMTTHTCEPCGVSEEVDPNDVTKCIKTNYIGLCPPATPRYDFNSKQCIACPQDTQYNKQTNNCDPVSNPSHFTYVQPLHAAANDSSGGVANQICSSDLRFYYPDCSQGRGCPTDRPIFNTGTNQCEPCPKGQVYYSDSKKCEKDAKCSATETLNRTTYTCIDTASTCRPNEVYILKGNRCLPKSITCSQHQFYSPDLQACVAIQTRCTQDEYYNPKTFKCASKLNTCKANEEYNEELHSCQKMILCKVDQQLNFKLRICEKRKLQCNQTIEYFDQYLLKCTPYAFATSPFSPNLILQSGLQDYLQQYQNLKASTPNFKDCPLKNPYYKKSSMECVACPSETPYFDIQQDKCVKCEDKLVYNPTSNRCEKINLTSVSTTINRLSV